MIKVCIPINKIKLKVSFCSCVSRSNPRPELRPLPSRPASFARRAPVRRDRQHGRTGHERGEQAEHAARVHGSGGAAGRGHQLRPGLPGRKPHPGERLRQDKPESRLVRGGRLVSVVRREQLGRQRDHRGEFFIILGITTNKISGQTDWIDRVK